MKRKGFIKEAFIYALIGAMIAGNITPVMAATDVDGGHDTFESHYGTVTETETCKEQTVSSEDADKSAECEVYAELGSNFIVTIPKKITLDGSTKKGGYTVDVEGDIAGTDIVKVVPDPSVALSSKNLADVTASISQDKTEWSYDQILADSKIVGNGAIDATGISAGAWNGTFNFNVGLESTGAGGSGSETPVSEAAGLYDADGNLLCTWEESGINDTCSNAKTIINNTYPTATKIVIPDSVTSIGQQAFYGCTSLTSIDIPSSVTSIGASAFSGCTGLTSITIPEGVTSIGENAFHNIQNINYNGTATGSPWGAKGINGYTFFELTRDNYTQAGITRSGDVVIPETFEYDGVNYRVTSIGSLSFACSSLTSIEIPDIVTSIGDGAFSECYDLTSINVDEDNEYYCSVDDVLFNKNKTTIVQYPAQKADTTYVIPNTVTSIGSSVFYYCTSLTDITIPEGVTSIGGGAFMWCSLTSVTIPDNVTSLGGYTFAYCGNLTSVTYQGTTYTNISELETALENNGMYLYDDFRDTGLSYLKN